jgi:hypothetical protein
MRFSLKVVASLKILRHAGYPQAARRAAPHNQRIQQSIPESGNPASCLAADPQRLSVYKQLHLKNHI